MNPPLPVTRMHAPECVCPYCISDRNERHRLAERVQIFKNAMHNATDRTEYKRQRDNWRAAQLTLERVL